MPPLLLMNLLLCIIVHTVSTLPVIPRPRISSMYSPSHLPFKLSSHSVLPPCPSSASKKPLRRRASVL
eukprot:7365013-Pyramimonas_sp.AAC.1